MVASDGEVGDAQMNRQVAAQAAALAVLIVVVGWWCWEMIARADMVGLIAPLGFAAVILRIWKPWRTLRGL